MSELRVGGGEMTDAVAGGDAGGDAGGEAGEMTEAEVGGEMTEAEAGGEAGEMTEAEVGDVSEQLECNDCWICRETMDATCIIRDVEVSPSSRRKTRETTRCATCFTATLLVALTVLTVKLRPDARFGDGVSCDDRGSVRRDSEKN